MNEEQKKAQQKNIEEKIEVGKEKLKEVPGKVHEAADKGKDLFEKATKTDVVSKMKNNMENLDEKDAELKKIFITFSDKVKLTLTDEDKREMNRLIEKGKDIFTDGKKRLSEMKDQFGEILKNESKRNELKDWMKERYPNVEVDQMIKQRDELMTSSCEKFMSYKDKFFPEGEKNGKKD